MTEGPSQEHGTNKPPPTERVQERSKWDTTWPSTSQNPPRWHPSWLSIACATRKDSESEGLARDNPETNPITIKPGTASHVTEQFSWAPLPSCSPPGGPLPSKVSCFVSMCVSSDNSFLSVRQAPHLRPWKGSPFLQHSYEFLQVGDTEDRVLDWACVTLESHFPLWIFIFCRRTISCPSSSSNVWGSPELGFVEALRRLQLN